MNSLRSRITIVVDENVHQLVPGLKDIGFKVIKVPKGTSDAEIRGMADGCAILTKNTDHFLDDMVADDYDLISIKDIKFIDTDETRNNSTVKKIWTAVRSTGFYNLKGNYLLDIKDDGSFKLTQIYI